MYLGARARAWKSEINSQVSDFSNRLVPSQKSRCAVASSRPVSARVRCTPRRAVCRQRRMERAADLPGRVRVLSWQRRAWPARRDSRLRHRSTGFHGLQPDDPRGQSRLAVGYPSGRSGARIQPDHACLRGRADRGGNRAGDRSRAHVLRGAGMAARRSQPSETVRHRKGVPGKRGGAHDDLSPKRIGRQPVPLRAPDRPAGSIRGVRAVRNAGAFTQHVAHGCGGYRRRLQTCAV